MNNRQYKRLITAILFILALLGVTIVLLFAVLNKPKDVQVNNYVGKNGTNGVVGAQGLSGIQGIQGVAGKDGQTVVNNYTTNVPVPGAQGEPGAAGSPNPQILIEVDPVTCKLLTKYDGDDIWNFLAQLPKPCVEVGNE